LSDSGESNALRTVWAAKPYDHHCRKSIFVAQGY
jgi:hypothetical protein